jgi:thiamine biosynthesis lipoprotein
MYLKETQLIMGMPITVHLGDEFAQETDIDEVFDYFITVDETFSTYKDTSEVSKINRGEITVETCSDEMREILLLCEETKKETDGYFDIVHNNLYDPSGLVKGWAIQKASDLLHNKGFKNFYIEAGGDMQTSGKNEKGESWKVGIRNPFNRDENVKVLAIEDKGVATSGTYIRGEHIYNPKENDELQRADDSIVSLTVVGSKIYDADRFATAAFAMGGKGIYFIESMPGFEGYMIGKDRQATYTSGFGEYVI